MAKVSKTRIYVVKDMNTSEKFLVKAISAAGALGHVVKTTFEVYVPGQDELVSLAGAGISVEVANEPVADQAPVAAVEPVPAEDAGV